MFFGMLAGRDHKKCRLLDHKTQAVESEYYRSQGECVGSLPSKAQKIRTISQVIHIIGIILFQAAFVAEFAVDGVYWWQSW
jgi:hypothetical protein